MMRPLPVEFGNADTLPTDGTGWIVGFSPWTRDGGDDLRHVPAGTAVDGVCVKWFAHPAGFPAGECKPISTGRTMSLLVDPHSEFRIDFSWSADFPPDATRTQVLRRCGDFAIWGEGIYHRAYALAPARILTVRWGADPG